MKVLIASSIDRDALEQLRQRHDVVCALNADEATLQSAIRDREVVVFRSGVTFSAEVMQCAPQLKLLVRAGSGFDNVDLDYIHRRKLEMVRIPEPGAKAVAEMAFAQMLALARNVVQADRLLRTGHWAKNELSGYLLTGKVLGIIGAGNIGSRVGRLGAAWDMEVIGCVGHATPKARTTLRKEGVRLTGCCEVLSRADFLTIHVPLSNSTRNLIDAEALARMKPGAFLVNTSRGGVVDEEALYRELTTEGRLRGAAMDVHQQEGPGKISPLAGLPNVLLTPHIGASTVDSQREIGERILSTINGFAKREREAVGHMPASINS
jgi:phosphoglycerate dehydrogenase-like enzyme